MAKRKRLTPPRADFLTEPAAPAEPKAAGAHLGPAPPGISAAGPAPIAQVAGAASASAALEELAGELRTARSEGRLVQALPLDQIERDYLVRDRLGVDPEGLQDLLVSIRERGQQTPIEVVELGPARFGLISGWRRLRALEQLRAETGDARFGRVLALLRRPDTAADAYRAMVEENEIRLGLSYYERARIAAKSAEAGVHADLRSAVRALFGAASRAKRSKILSFAVLHAALDDRLRFAAAIPERLGLALARALEGDPDLAGRLRERLRKSAPDTAEAELALLGRAVQEKPGKPAQDTKRPPNDPKEALPQGEEIRPGIWLQTEGGFSRAVLTLAGPKVDAPFRDRLVAWLRETGQG